MFKNKTSLNQIASFVTGVLILLITLSIPGTVYADGPATDNGKCISCHQDLYYLHDTGNWFCLEESPMACVDCHGGNPNTLVKAEAHINRAQHPVINDDISKCQECHPAQCDERVEIFEQTAGISNVLVAVPFTPSHSTEQDGFIPVTSAQQEPVYLVTFWEMVPLILVAGFAIALRLILHKRRN